jgi:hypothetical protein
VSFGGRAWPPKPLICRVFGLHVRRGGRCVGHLPALRECRLRSAMPIDLEPMLALRSATFATELKHLAFAGRAEPPTNGLTMTL